LRRALSATQDVSTFGLVHGAYHGSWCWEKLKNDLENRGHRVLTVDLPSEDPDAGGREYAAAAAEAFGDAPDDLVLVGHSLAGLTIPLVPFLRPVSRMVFVCAMLPRPGRSHNEVLSAEPDMAGSPSTGDGAFTDARGATRWRPQVAATWFFSDCSPEVATWAANQLRGQHWRITEEVTPVQIWPSVPSTTVIGRHDPVINPPWSRRVSPVVLGVSPVELECGHSPFLSAPAQLADVLVRSAPQT
jgi:pimeloyl-ACP methyl ester carboxylesterase